MIMIEVQCNYDDIGTLRLVSIHLRRFLPLLCYRLDL